MQQQSLNKRPRPKLTSPLLPRGVDIIVQPPSYDACTFVDKLLVYASSLTVIGSPLYFYFGIYWLYKKWKHYRALAKEDVVVLDKDNYTSSGESSQEIPSNIQQCARYEKLSSRYAAALAMVLIISFWGPHRSKRVGEWLHARRWRLWDSWLNYVGFTVLHDRGDDDTTTTLHPEFDPQSSDAMYAFVPHGIFPFGLAFSCLPERGYNNTWGLFRPVVATATRLFPLVRTFIAWMGESPRLYCFIV